MEKVGKSGEYLLKELLEFIKYQSVIEFRLRRIINQIWSFNENGKYILIFYYFEFVDANIFLNSELYNGILID